MKKITMLWGLGAVLLLTFACSNDDDTNGGSAFTTAVMTTYADIALANYTDALDDARALKDAIAIFVATPTAVNFEAAKKAWLTSRESYGTTEAFRFANGPIDSGDTEEIEGLLNSWPLDEAYVDYVDGDLNAGIINNTTGFPTLTKELLETQNGEGGEENVSVGYHAIEFLLWGQDLTDPSLNQSGQRPFTDYVDSSTAENQDRRRQYLALLGELLVEHLQVIADAWEGSFRSSFLQSDQEEALKTIINSISEFSKGELAGERMRTALNNQDQEDEHSCFSDNTHRDIRLNLQGVKNIYTGSYIGNNSTVNGASLADLIEDADADLAEELNTLLGEAETKVEATDAPFDQAIAGGPTTPEGEEVGEAIEALSDFADKLLEAKAELGIVE